MFKAKIGTAIILLFMMAGCTSLFSGRDNPPGATSPPPTVRPSFVTGEPTEISTPVPGVDPAANSTNPSETDVQILINISDRRPLSPGIRGSNVPAWLGSDVITDPLFLERATAAGVTVLRLPGGSWSNSYDWLACERDGQGIDETAECFWPWAAKPSDFLTLIGDFDGEIIYTLNGNATAQEAAALVAFFNGRTGDRTVIGRDMHGRNWGTIGQWAALRAERGHPTPVGITYWEVGNEFYGGTADSGTDCSEIGWEEVWTCDGREYVLGIEGQDGFLAFAEAIRVVDPDAQVGAIGVSPQREWSNWGNEVLLEAGPVMDFYIIHQYGYFEPPRNIEEVLTLPSELWPAIMRDYRTAAAGLVPNRDIPVAITEFNLFAFQENDTGQLMRRAVNAFFLADTLGLMGWHGVDMAAQWNMANGRAENGTDYGLLDGESLEPLPGYYVYPLWADFGDDMVKVELSDTEPARLTAYAGLEENGRVSLLLLNKTDQPLSVAIIIDDQPPELTGTAHTLTATSLESETVAFNGQEQPAVLPPARPIDWAAPGVVTVPPLSITRFFLSP